MATPRKLDFPDVNDPNFDKDVPFEADNGLTYKWNGNAWEVVCGAGTGDDGFLLKHGHIVDDAPDPVIYDWNEPVTLQHGPNEFNKSSIKIASEKLDIIANENIEVNANNGYFNTLMDTGTLNIGGAEEIRFDYDGVKLVKDILSGTHDKHVVDKKYVDEKAAFLQGEIVELEEEIEAIAITSERGEWISATNIGTGEFRMVGLGGNTI